MGSVGKLEQPMTLDSTRRHLACRYVAVTRFVVTLLSTAVAASAAPNSVIEKRRVDNIPTSPPQLPAITNVSPLNRPPGTNVTVSGSNLFNKTAGISQESTTPVRGVNGDAIVKFNGVVAAVLSNSGTQIQTVVPAGATKPAAWSYCSFL